MGYSIGFAFPWEAPVVSRREQLGLADSQPKKPGRGRGKGKGRGRGRGCKPGAGEGGDSTPSKTTKTPSASSRPSTMKRPAAKAKASPKKRAKTDKKKMEKGGDKVDEKVDEGVQKGKGKKRLTTPSEAPDASPPPEKLPKTWARRWIPYDKPVELAKFRAIKQVFEEFLAKKLKAQSSFQPAWFVVVSDAFRTHNFHGEVEFDQLVAVAELEVESFLKRDDVSHSHWIR